MCLFCWCGCYVREVETECSFDAARMMMFFKHEITYQERDRQKSAPLSLSDEDIGVTDDILFRAGGTLEVSLVGDFSRILDESE